MYPCFVIFPVNNGIKKPGLFFPETPGTVIMLLTVFIDKQDFFVGKIFGFDHVDGKA
jgi:hypothetical protein